MVSFSMLSVDTPTIVFIVLLVVLIVALLVVPMFTNKKRAKQTEELHNSLQPGDLIKTVGGIIGTVKEVRQVSPVDKEMVIETGVGDNKTTMTFDIAALYQVMSRSSSTVAAKADNEDNTPEPEKADEVFAPAVEAEEKSAEQAAPDSGEVAEQPAQEATATEQEAKEAVEEKAEAAPAAVHPAKKPVAKKSTKK